MIVIQGEKFQDLCETQISKMEHKQFESNVHSIDIDNFDFTDFNNSELVYCNVSLINERKPKLAESKLYEKLKLFKNPFKLILHNADDSFEKEHLKYFDIPNCKQIFTQNVNVLDSRVEFLPIGIANHFWKWGDAEKVIDVILEDIEKVDLVYAHFTERDNRVDCYDNVKRQGIPIVKSMEYKDYLRKLKTYKYCVSPEGNGIDCYRTWEALYMKTIPICKRSILVEEFAKTFPIYIVDDWKDLNVKDLEKQYDTFNWDNWYQLDFETYCRKVGL
jgi:hypothetical protein